MKKKVKKSRNLIKKKRIKKNVLNLSKFQNFKRENTIHNRKKEQYNKHQTNLKQDEFESII